MNPIASSELVLNPDGSVYHLHLRPDQIAPVVILVGDPGRVALISRHFDRIDHKIQNREFITHTGWLGGKQLSVMATGIGTDNIDIVVNELDALVNIDFSSRTIRPERRSLSLVRLGTCGIIRPELEVGSTLISEMACGFDGLLRYYGGIEAVTRPILEEAFARHMEWNPGLPIPYFTPAHPSLFQHLLPGNIPVVTVSAPGFYAPQGRVLRLPLAMPDLHTRLRTFQFEGIRISNFEMECSALYGLSNLLGHKALTICAAIANRSTGAFDHNYPKTMDRLIQNTLDQLCCWV